MLDELSQVYYIFLESKEGTFQSCFRIHLLIANCQKNQIGDEYHYIFECTNLSEKCKSLLPKHLIKHPNILKFKNLMTSKQKLILEKLCKFIRYII